MPSKQPEFLFSKKEVYCHLVFVTIHLTYMCKLAIDYAMEYKQQTQTSMLSGYIGRERDSHDIQWNTYRQNLPMLALGMLAWYLISKIVEKGRNQKSYLLGLAIIVYSFRSDSILYLGCLYLWYVFTMNCSKFKYFVQLCWIIVIFSLYLNQFTDHFSYISEQLGNCSPILWFNSSQRQINAFQILNMTFLKLLSFSIDRKRGSQKRQLQKHIQKCQQCQDNEQIKEYCLKARNLIDTDNYTIKTYFNYALFAPTLLTGPPLSYKNFISFQQFPSTKKPQILHTIIIIIAFQFYQHFSPVIMLNESQSFVQGQIFTLFHLVFIWFKFLVIWRVAKVWAQLCGIEVIDNLSRCVCNNYGFQGFWRMWHRGFNQWLVRYLYIPLGGNTTLLSTISVIAFVAFWHDHTLNIVVWAFTFILFILPQLTIKRYFKKNHPDLFSKHWFKYTAALTSAFYIYLLIFTNIIGFGYGVDKAYLIIDKIQNQWMSVMWSLIVLSSAVILMFYQRSLQPDVNF